MRPIAATEITIDARWLRLGGMGTYTYNLISRFRQHGGNCRLRLIAKREDIKQVEPFCSSVTTSEASMYTLREQFEIPWKAQGGGIFHALHYNAPLLYRGPLVVSILDVIHITEPTYSKSLRAWGYARPMLKLVAERAKHIVTISEYSKSQIVQLLRIPSSKISVIYCGVSNRFYPGDRESARAAIEARFGVPGPWILYVGNLKPHKNVSTLFEAVGLLRRRHAIPHKLLVVGNDRRWGEFRKEECKIAGISDITYFVEHVSEDLLRALYAAADLFVMPSTLEGFGLPVLEAMACGTPVVCSRAASLPEVGGDAVLYFDPRSSMELANAMERVASSPDLRETLGRKGLERAKLFDWDNSVREHVNLYRLLLGSH